MEDRVIKHNERQDHEEYNGNDNGDGNERQQQNGSDGLATMRLAPREHT